MTDEVWRDVGKEEEREECAKIADEFAVKMRQLRTLHPGAERICEDIAAAIRARGKG